MSKLENLNYNEELREIKIEKNLRDAIIKEELELYYQPQIDISTGKICSMEALVRWNSKELGIIPPSEFIKIAEKTGLINEMGEWILLTACKQNKIWKEKGYNYNYMAVNISAIQLEKEDFVTQIKNALDNSKLRPENLELEITENILMDSLKCNIETLKKLKKMGVRIALDDFGKGYSSLNYLRILPMDTLKIDKCFIDNICYNENEKAIIKCIIELATILNLDVVAEGVEYRQQLDVLKNLNCFKIQGYYFSKPLKKDDMEAMLDKLK
ncbi:putative bifunctional diguanylate cyclase/phosphodiesterase [Clostridium rectalis]|uniref:putative bifunctional diguanylate cyclase/phosphodiesterase n=1 Tax=Clostridium rectalis TaxID=2040295 RepID=UPI000F63249B|nr:EAL domain-containing protein [Clostridium rectalis]